MGVGILLFEQNMIKSPKLNRMSTMLELIIIIIIKHAKKFKLHSPH